jgi:hypothetical protein
LRERATEIIAWRMSFPLSLAGAAIAASVPAIPAAPVHATLGVTATVVRHVSLSSAPVGPAMSTVSVAGEAFDTMVEGGELVRSSDGRLSVRATNGKTPVLTITF